MPSETSCNRLFNTLHCKNELLPASSAEAEMLPYFKGPNDHPEDVKIIEDAPGNDMKVCQAPNLQ